MKEFDGIINCFFDIFLLLIFPHQAERDIVPHGEVAIERIILEGETDAPTSEDKTEEKNAVQDRINKLTRKRYEAERKAEEEAAKRRELEEKLSQYENRLPPKPKYDDFDTEEAFNDAVDQWTDKAAEVKSRQSQKAPEAPQNDMQSSIQKVQAAVAKASEYIPGIQEVVSDPNLPVDADMVQYLADSDKAAEVLHHLGTHLDQAYELSRMPPAQKFRELAKLESSLKKPESKKVTSAPEPPEPIGESDGSPKDPEKMSTEEWIRRRNAKIYGG